MMDKVRYSSVTISYSPVQFVVGTAVRNYKLRPNWIDRVPLLVLAVTVSY
jgi:hypothetical protein